MDERSSKALEAMLREHDEDSVTTESSLPRIRATFRIPNDFNLHVLEVGQCPFEPFLNRFNLSVDALEAGKLKDESDLVAIMTVEAQANEATAKLDEVQLGKPRPSRRSSKG
ncbi:hypothetical protein BHE74_00019854 [Ensete ventricosum]|nr:hypothetical protein GW17_00032511 [Ensete ventricosum]RWW72342.1 hypothetical protein BHE74_00019854 [Ensete ventricosum]